MDYLGVINRLKEVLSISSDKQLAEYLNIQPNTLTNWKYRTGLNYEQIIDICKDINLNWLFFGTGKKEPDVSNEALFKENETLKVQNELLKELLDKAHKK